MTCSSLFSRRSMEPSTWTSESCYAVRRAALWTYFSKGSRAWRNELSDRICQFTTPLRKICSTLSDPAYVCRPLRKVHAVA